MRSGCPCPASAGVRGAAGACGGADGADGASGRAQVSLTADFSACRVYWKATPSAERDTCAGAALRRSAAHMR